MHPGSTNLGDIFDRDVSEGCCISLITHERRDLAHQRFYEMPNGHAGRDGMRVDDQVWNNALGCVW